MGTEFLSFDSESTHYDRKKQQLGKMSRTKYAIKVLKKIIAANGIILPSEEIIMCALF